MSIRKAANICNAPCLSKRSAQEKLVEYSKAPDNRKDCPAVPRFYDARDHP